MVWLKLLKLLLQLSSDLTVHLQSKQLMEAGEASAIREMLYNAIHRSNEAIKARNAAGAKFDARNGVPDDNDPNLRD